MVKACFRTLCLALAGVIGGGAPAFAADAKPNAKAEAKGAAAADTPLPSKAFFSLPEVRMPRLSPDGSKIAFLFPLESRMALGVFDRKTKEARMVIRGRDESLVSFSWKGNDRLIFTADFQGNESQFVASTDLEGKRVVRIVETQPTEFVIGSAGRMEDTLPLQPDHIVISGIFRKSDAFNMASTTTDFVVARVNIRNRGISTIYTYDNNERIRDNVLDNAGVMRLRARIEHGKTIVWEHRPTDTAAWREIARNPMNGYIEAWEPRFFTGDNKSFYVVVYTEHDRGALHLYDTETMTLGPVLFTPPEGQITGISTSYDRTKLYGVAYEGAKTKYHWFDEGRGILQASLEAAFPGLEVTVTSTSVDEQVCLVHVGSDREAGVYFVLDRKAGSLTQFKRVRELDPRLLRPMEPVKFTARDGLEIHGYLTRPAGAEGKKVPLIIHPHGGPFGQRDSWGYNAEVQFLASRGYAVLQVNFRGSGGYGVSFLNKGRRQWGRAMQDDLTDAVHWAVDQGIADPARVAIYGASYGGYATLAGLVFTPELYCCGVNYVGASDLNITYKPRGSDAYLRPNDYSYQREWVGETEEYRDATSPVNFVDRIQVPTLHAYGEKDPRVEFDHWTRLKAQLDKLGKPYESIEQRRQGHGFRDEKASNDFYVRMDQFLAENLMNPKGRVKVGKSQVIEMPARP